MTVIVQGIDKMDVPWIWPEALELLEPAIERDSGRMSAQDVLMQARQGLVKLWIATEEGHLIGITAARPVKYPAKKGLFIMFIAGHEREKWQERMMAVVEEGARHIGCDIIEGIGRRGFGRILPGYRVAGFVYEKDLVA